MNQFVSNEATNPRTEKQYLQLPMAKSLHKNTVVSSASKWKINGKPQKSQTKKRNEPKRASQHWPVAQIQFIEYIKFGVF